MSIQTSVSLAAGRVLHSLPVVNGDIVRPGKDVHGDQPAACGCTADDSSGKIHIYKEPYCMLVSVTFPPAPEFMAFFSSCLSKSWPSNLSAPWVLF